MDQNKINASLLTLRPSFATKRQLKNFLLSPTASDSAVPR